MATKKTKKSKGILGFLDDKVEELATALGQQTKKPAPLTQDYSDGSSAGSYVGPAQSTPDRVRRGVLSIKAQPTTYNEFMAKSSALNTADPFKASYGAGYESKFALNTNHAPLNNRHNALISFDGVDFGIPLFVRDLQIDFQLVGNTSQSQKGAVFYPKNFTQTDLKLTCQSISPAYYGKVMEAVRDSQMPFAKVSKLQVWQPTDRNRAIKGSWKNIDCDGYVKQAVRRHERFQYTPDFDLTFTVVQFRSPSEWADDIKNYKINSDWHDLVTPTTDNSMEFEDIPDLSKTASEQAEKAKKGTYDSAVAGYGMTVEQSNQLKNSKNR